MEINYELIIKYLVGKKTIEKIDNIFTTQKNIYTYSTSWPDNFKQLFTDKFYRYGISLYDNENNNISFWASLITLLYDEFLISYIEDELTIINNFRLQLIDKYNHAKLSAFIKKLDKNDFRERFKLNPDNDVLQYIVDILNINLLILDFKDNIIRTVYPDDIMNPWKQTLLLSRYNSFWEPIMLVNSKGEIQRLFDYNNVIIKKILYTNGLVIYNSPDKVFSITGEINYIIDHENSKLNNVSISTKYDIKKLNKMKLDELLALTKELQITIDIKKPTKALLINLIIKKNISIINE
jgi:hypothetical protein